MDDGDESMDDIPLDLQTEASLFQNEMLEYQLNLLAVEISKMEDEIGIIDMDDINEDEEYYQLDKIRVPKHCIPIRTDVRIFDWKVCNHI